MIEKDGVAPLKEEFKQPDYWVEGQIITPVTSFWPRQSVYHGCVMGVEWKSGGGQYADEQSIANPDDIDVGIGHTQSEALAAVISSQFKENNPTMTDSERHHLEELLVGFSQGLMGDLDNPDGVYQFDQAIHRYTFDDQPSGQLYDFVPMEHGGYDSLDGVSDETRLSPIVCLDCESYQDSTMDLSDSSAICHNCGSNNLKNSRIPKVATYAGPRFYEPKDPNIVFTNTLRSTRHGGDGGFEEDGTLKCRFTGQYHDRWLHGFQYVNYDWYKIPENQIIVSHGSVPNECYELYDESGRMDGSRYYHGGVSVPSIPAQIGLEGLDSLKKATKMYSNNKLDKLSPGSMFGENFYLIGDNQDTSWLDFVLGVAPPMPSPIAFNAWSQAWVPLFLDYKIEYWPDKYEPGESGNWSMSDPDFEYDGNIATLQSGLTPLDIVGRTPLSSSAGKVIAAQIGRMLDEEDSLEEAESLDIYCPDCDKMTGEMEDPPLREVTFVSSGEQMGLPTNQVQCQGKDSDDNVCGRMLEPDDDILGSMTEEMEDEMRQLQSDYNEADLLTAVFSDINDVLRDAYPDEVLRAGVMRVSKLDIIDTFGQILPLGYDSGELQDGGTSEPSIALSMESMTWNGERVEFMLKPRIPDGARLQFRLLSGSDDSLEAHAGTTDMNLEKAEESTPLCAFLLPDHIEWAMEVFDSNGDARGQLRVAERDWLEGGVQKGRLDWDPAPGSEVGIGQLPNSGNQHVDSMLTKLVELSLEDQIEVNNPKCQPCNLTFTPSQLSAGANPPCPQCSTPISTPEGVLSALLRAIDTTYWDMDPFGQGGDDIPAVFMGRPVAVVRAKVCLEIDVPDVNEPEYFNYATHFEELDKTKFEVKLGSLDKITDGLLGYFVNDDYSRFNAVYPTSQGGSNAPHLSQDNDLEHQFMVFDPTIELRPNQEMMLTLVMNPQSTIHATSCLLPQKEIGMVRTHYEKAMNKIAPTFKIGPVLVDPENVRMPIPNRQGLIWSWNFKESYTDWKETPITDADHLAGLPKGKSSAFDGWIKLDIDESQES